MIRAFLPLSGLYIAIAAAALTTAAQADSNEARTSDHNKVFEAVRSGRIQPLSAILKIVTRDYKVTVIDVEFEIEDGIWIYEIVGLTSSGHVTEFYFDAATTRLLKIKSDGKTEAFR